MDQDAERIRPDDTPHSSKPDAPASAGAPLPPKPARSDPQEVLPTDRVAFDKQLQFLLAYAAASEKGAKGVSNEAVANLVRMKASTVSLANAFFVKCGFLTRSAREYLPSKEVLEYHLAVGWNDPNAAHKLAPLVTRTWFAQTLRPKLEMRPVEESEAIGDLAQRAVVTRVYGPQLKTLLDYMETAGIVRREGSLLTLNRTIDQPVNDKRAPDSVDTPPSTMTCAPLSGLSGGRGAIQFSVNIDVDMAEIAKWRPDRITAFFGGLAAVVAAKKGDGEPI